MASRPSNLVNCVRGLAFIGTLSVPAQAVAQEHIYVSCQPTTFWTRDEARNGAFGRQFTMRLGNDGYFHWQAETRSWREQEPSRCSSRPCISRFGEGEAAYDIWPEVEVGSRSHKLTVSRVTGAYQYRRFVQTPVPGTGGRMYEYAPDWHEEGICSATENPETAQTQRVF